MIEKLVNSVVVVRLCCWIGLVCIKGARGSYAADIFLVAWCLQVESWITDSILESEQV